MSSFDHSILFTITVSKLAIIFFPFSFFPFFILIGSAVKVILLNIEDCEEELQHSALNKMAHGLLSLTSVESAELRYVVLRCIRLITQKVPNLLSQNIQVFFCKYNDPYYVKMEKLELLISLATSKHIERVLSEFKE